MPWDGALPMLRHGPLQLKVITFPVSPSSFFSVPPPPLSSSCPPSSSLAVLHKGTLSLSLSLAPSLSRVPALSPVPLLFLCRLALTLAFFSPVFHNNLLLEMAVVQLLTALRVCGC